MTTEEVLERTYAAERPQLRDHLAGPCLRCGVFHDALVPGRVNGAPVYCVPCAEAEARPQRGAEDDE